MIFLWFFIKKSGHGMSFEQWVKSTHTAVEIYSVLFQIFYTLECFNQIHIRHNDLHMGNIYIETQIPNQNFIYFTSPDTYFVIPVTNLVKIYDFDRSFSWNDAGIFFLFFCENLKQNLFKKTAIIIKIKIIIFFVHY